jgi:hypothetical protein
VVGHKQSDCAQHPCPDSRGVSGLDGGDAETVYAPFLNGKPWPRFPVVAYVETESNVWVHPLAPKRFPTVTEIHDPDSDSTTTLIHFPDGRQFKTVNAFTNQFVVWPFLSAVYSVDFNGDGKPDFVAVKAGSGWTTGNNAYPSGNANRPKKYPDHKHVTFQSRIVFRAIPIGGNSVSLQIIPECRSN